MSKKKKLLWRVSRAILAGFIALWGCAIIIIHVLKIKEPFFESLAVLPIVLFVVIYVFNYEDKDSNNP